MKTYTILITSVTLAFAMNVMSFFANPVGQIHWTVLVAGLILMGIGIYQFILSKNIKAMVYTIQEKKGDKVFVKIIAENTTKAPEGAFVMVDDAKPEEIGQIISNLSAGYRTMYGEKAVILTEIR